MVAADHVRWCGLGTGPEDYSRSWPGLTAALAWPGVTEASYRYTVQSILKSGLSRRYNASTYMSCRDVLKSGLQPVPC